LERRKKVELFEQMRREYEHGVGTINGVAKKLGVHRRMVREALASATPKERKRAVKNRYKLEPAQPGPNSSLYQCKTCRMVVTDQAMLAGHILKAHIGDYFEKTEIVAEPPAGQFTSSRAAG